MIKFIFIFVNICLGVLFLTSGCITKSESAANKDEGWIEMESTDGKDSGIINPDDYK